MVMSLSVQRKLGREKGDTEKQMRINEETINEEIKNILYKKYGIRLKKDDKSYKNKESK